SHDALSRVRWSSHCVQVIPESLCVARFPYSRAIAVQWEGARSRDRPSKAAPVRRGLDGPCSIAGGRWRRKYTRPFSVSLASLDSPYDATLRDSHCTRIQVGRVRQRERDAAENGFRWSVDQDAKHR